MKTNKVNGEQYCETREELVDKYFFGIGRDEGNLPINSILSDLQHQIEAGFDARSKEHYRRVLNDIKCILGTDDVKRREAERDARLTDEMLGNELSEVWKPQ